MALSLIATCSAATNREPELVRTATGSITLCSETIATDGKLVTHRDGRTPADSSARIELAIQTLAKKANARDAALNRIRTESPHRIVFRTDRTRMTCSFRGGDTVSIRTTTSPSALRLAQGCLPRPDDPGLSARALRVCPARRNTTTSGCGSFPVSPRRARMASGWLAGRGR